MAKPKINLAKFQDLSPEQQKRAMKQYYLSHGLAPEMGEKGQVVLNYAKDVVTGKVARRGLEDLASAFTSGDPEKILDYVGPGKIAGVAGWIGSKVSKGAKLNALEAAKAYEKEGISREEILGTTGWFKLGDRWRFFDEDIIDDIAKTKGKILKEIPFNEGTFPLKDVVQTPSFWKHATPELGGKTGTLKLDARELEKYNARGAFFPKDAQVVLPPSTLKKDPLFTSAHELEHYIQRSQGRPGGTSSTTVLKALDQKTNLPEGKKRELAQQQYKHSQGEAEAKLLQKYLTFVQHQLAQGNTPEQVKKMSRKINPWKVLKSSGIDPEKLWVNKESMKALSERPQKPTQRPSHNMQNRERPARISEAQEEMKWFLDQHDYPFYIKKDGSVSVDVYDSAGKVKRHTATDMKELRKILGY